MSGREIGQVEAYLVRENRRKDCPLRLFAATFEKRCSGDYVILLRRQSGARLHGSRKKEEVYFLRRNVRKRRLG